jgi:osmotically-inducible protein OsmY
MILTEQSGRSAELLGLSLAPANSNVAERAESRLRCNSYLALRNVSCEYREGVLTLRGCLPTYYLKQVAQAAVDHLEGVHRIVNEIEVTPSARSSACPV